MWKYITLSVLLVAACFEQVAPAGVPKAKPAPKPKAVAATAESQNPLCKERNRYVPIESNCDAYIECRDYKATEMLCPDGLHFNPKAAWPEYPCGYPMDISCQGRGAPQPANPTEECPHQYGFFPSPHAQETSNCGQYRMCVMGMAIEMMCPVGLAFDPATGRCDWPDLVPTCKVEEFLGFQCPPAMALGEDGQPLDVTYNYMYPGNCYAFYSCTNGRLRLLSCDAGFAFDEASGKCIDAEKVNCAGPLL